MTDAETRQEVRMTDADRILAAGVPITLADGSTAHVRFGHLGVKLLEDEFGSIGKLQTMLDEVFGSEDSDPTGPAYSMFWSLIRIGLRKLHLDDDDLDELLDPGETTSYMEAVSEALSQGFGAGPKAKAPVAMAQAAGGAQKKPSTGRGSTTSRPSRSGAQMSSSGP